MRPEFEEYLRRWKEGTDAIGKRVVQLKNSRVHSGEFYLRLQERADVPVDGETRHVCVTKDMYTMAQSDHHDPDFEPGADILQLSWTIEKLHDDFMKEYQHTLSGREKENTNSWFDFT